MKNYSIMLACLFLFSCNCSKQTTMVNPQKVALESTCPKEGDCKIEILENKKMNVLDDGTGSLYYRLEDDLEHKVIKYTYDKRVKGDLQDANYREEIVFEIENEIKEETITNENLQNVKMLFGRFCYCKGQAGNFKVNNGNLKITKDKIDLDFEIKEVPQIIKNISIVLK